MILSKEDASHIRKGKDFTFHASRSSMRLGIRQARWSSGSQYVIEDGERTWDGLVFFSGHDEHSGWPALKALVRAGDRLEWSFFDNSNGYSKVAQIPKNAWPDADDRRHHPDYFGLHVDCLFVTIWRNGKAVVSNLQVCQSEGPDNSSRAIRKGAY